jgi:RNA polymerase sigma-70 factor (ECF subfamily)
VGTDGGGGPGDHADRRARFERIYAGSYEPILGYALRRTPAPEDAADVVAETFLTAWRRLDELPDPPDARLWLYATARRVLANQRRGQQRYQRLAVRLGVVRAGAPAGVAVEDHDTSAVVAAFGRLKAEDREVLGLLAWEGLEPGEIAQVLGCGAGTVRVRLHRARRRFAHQLAVEGLAVEGLARP